MDNRYRADSRRSVPAQVDRRYKDIFERGNSSLTSLQSVQPLLQTHCADSCNGLKKRFSGRETLCETGFLLVLTCYEKSNTDIRKLEMQYLRRCKCSQAKIEKILPPPLVQNPPQPTMPVQSCRLSVASRERPRMLNLYMDDWKAVAHAPALLANSVYASPDVVFGLARFTSEANL